MRKEDARWKCPTCGTTGVALRSRAPLCHVCHYKVTMVLLEADEDKKGETSSDVGEGN